MFFFIFINLSLSLFGLHKMDVQMHRPHTKSRNYMDSLLAFWPGLQVLFGDLKPAIQTHEMLYQVMQMHTFLPEAFDFDFQVYSIKSYTCILDLI